MDNYEKDKTPFKDKLIFILTPIVIVGLIGWNIYALVTEWDAIWETIKELIWTIMLIGVIIAVAIYIHNL